MNNQTYYSKNKDKMNKDTVDRRRRNRDKYLEYQRKYKKERSKVDPQFRLINAMRKRVCKILKRKSKGTLDLLGCSVGELRSHLEKQFKSGMSWANYGLYGWHVDHIIPLASTTNTSELEKLCHYSNLQPLWASENLKKSNKLTILTVT